MRLVPARESFTATNGASVSVSGGSEPRGEFLQMPAASLFQWRNDMITQHVADRCRRGSICHRGVHCLTIAHHRSGSCRGSIVISGGAHGRRVRLHQLRPRIRHLDAQPGVYCGGISITNGATAHISIPEPTSLTAATSIWWAETTDTGTGVTFYLTGTNATYGGVNIGNGTPSSLFLHPRPAPRPASFFTRTAPSPQPMEPHSQEASRWA